MDDTRAPTGRELEILKLLWEHGPSSVRTVYRAMLDQQPDGRDLAYNTVQTLLRLMESKGLVRSRPEGRAFIYTPLYSREQTAARFLDRVFDGAVSQLVASLLDAERIPTEELDRMQALIVEARKKRGSR